jgi:hypothetical protein
MKGETSLIVGFHLSLKHRQGRLAGHRNVAGVEL